MKSFSFLLSILFAASALAQNQSAPSYPLITHSPYFSIWSNTDSLHSSTTKHWTGAPHSLTGILKVDDQYYSFLGKPDNKYASVLPAADEQPYKLRYTESDPGSGWNTESYSEKNWLTGAAPFSDDESRAKTIWKSKDLWVRRSFTVKDINAGKYFLKIHHDDNIEVFLNGANIYSRDGWNDRFDYIELDAAIRSNLKKGKNLLAAYIKNTAGGRHLDLGISVLQPQNNSPRIQNAKQLSSEVNALQTSYRFICGNVELSLNFTSPLLPDDLALLSRPVSYISYKLKSLDGKEHDVKLYFGASSDIAVNEGSQEVNANSFSTASLSMLRTGTTEQPLLKKKGDNLRIDWGHFYIAANKTDKAKQFISASHDEAISSFISGKSTRIASKKGRILVLGTILDFDKIDAKGKEKFMMLGYDELFSVQYFSQNLRPWWNRKGNRNFNDILEEAAAQYDSIIRRSNRFDHDLFIKAEASGGADYARLCALAYRQSVAAHILVESPQGEPLFLSKENFSNGSINTVDVTYPSAPLYLYYNPVLLKGMLNGIFYYSESGKWTKPFPAHDLGTYPIANGQTYGEDMPVEEAGNMVILAAAICHAEGNASYAKLHWESLTRWAAYLEKEGLDPANQLCTDDFAGHLARNANLSVKAIVALGAYGAMAKSLGYTEIHSRFAKLPKDLAQKWMQLADAGDHYALTFDNKNSWSQKYNLVWDKVLALDIFPKKVYDAELEWYLRHQQQYGLPLDSRKTYTKSDWIIWTATMADLRMVFDQLANPVYRYVTSTPSRVPLSDWHETTTGQMVGFQARSVVGGYFMKMLRDKYNR